MEDNGVLEIKPCVWIDNTDGKISKAWGTVTVFPDRIMFRQKQDTIVSRLFGLIAIDYINAESLRLYFSDIVWTIGIRKSKKELFVDTVLENAKQSKILNNDANTDVAIIGSKERCEKDTSEVLIRCPHCGKMSKAIKRMTIPEVSYFLLYYNSIASVRYTSCPHCMRKKILSTMAINIITTHIFWPIFILPWSIVSLINCSQKGHFPGASVASRLHII